jgi:hypothetical protein
MDKRSGLYVALVGLLIVIACAVPVNVVPDNGTRESGGASGLVTSLVVLMYAGGFIGITVIVVGLVIAGVAALRGRREVSA